MPQFLKTLEIEDYLVLISAGLGLYFTYRYFTQKSTQAVITKKVEVPVPVPVVVNIPKTAPKPKPKPKPKK